MSKSGSATNGYALAKSASSSSLQESADNMLKDLEGSLKASSNYIESHRTYSGPEGTQEYHEVRQYNSGGGGGDAPGSRQLGDFDLERQVQHMMPAGASSMLNGSSTSASSQLQSTGMVSSVQQQKQSSSYTTYKVQTNQYSSGGDRIEYQQQPQQGSRPGSRLKQNIDELDTLLDDLNNARKVPSDTGGDYTAASSDYSYHDQAHLQDHVKKTVTSYNECNYQSGSYQPSGKPPSPSPRRRVPSGSAPLSSPTAVRKSSPGPSRQLQLSSSSSSYNYSQQQQREQQQQRDIYPERPAVQDGTPTGVSYYTKYHSAHSHQSQGSGPVSFPTKDCAPRVGMTRTQSPPKRVDELMTELSEFDSSIHHTGFVEPAERPPQRTYREPSPEPYRPPPREPSPARPVKQQSTPGPAVYYPPGDVFSAASKPKPIDPPIVRASGSDAGPVVLETAQHKSLYDGKARPQSAASSRKDRGAGAESDGKSGAAVVPICLPLCCAAPCVIM